MNVKTKKKKLLKELPDMMKGSFAQTSRSCGKANCKRCQKGEKHPVHLFCFRVDGKQKVVSIPKKFHGQVKKLVDNWYRHKNHIEKLSDINVELIKKGELEE